MMRFVEFACPRCGTTLPVEVRYDNQGMVRVSCFKCSKCVYIFKQKIVKKEDYSTKG